MQNRHVMSCVVVEADAPPRTQIPVAIALFDVNGEPIVLDGSNSGGGGGEFIDSAADVALGGDYRDYLDAASPMTGPDDLLALNGEDSLDEALALLMKTLCASKEDGGILARLAEVEAHIPPNF